MRVFRGATAPGGAALLAAAVLAAGGGWAADLTTGPAARLTARLTAGLTAGLAAADEPGPAAAAAALPGTDAWRRDPLAAGALPDPGRAAAAEVSRFFAALPPADRLALARRHPALVGNLDGVPVPLRYEANTRALTLERDRERRRAADPAQDAGSRRRAAARAARYATLLLPGRRVLAFDPRGRGLVAEVHGDLVRAGRVAVFVPGSDIDLGSFDRLSRPLGTPAGMAAALRAETGRLDRRAPVAVVAWAGYVTPRGLGLAAATAGYARPGADRLRRLVAGLRATGRDVAGRDAPGRRAAGGEASAGRSVALFCHSYGSVVCGLAAPGLAAADIVVFGSPGMRAPSAEDLRTPAQVWAARTRGDWIGRVPHVRAWGLGHGADPVSNRFRARVVSTAGGRGHEGYLAPGTASLRNFALIALGRYPAVSCAAGAAGDACRDGLGRTDG
jgi:hypothetical protein